MLEARARESDEASALRPTWAPSPETWCASSASPNANADSDATPPRARFSNAPSCSPKNWGVHLPAQARGRAGAPRGRRTTKPRAGAQTSRPPATARPRAVAGVPPRGTPSTPWSAKARLRLRLSATRVAGADVDRRVSYAPRRRVVRARRAPAPRIDRLETQNTRDDEPRDGRPAERRGAARANAPPLIHASECRSASIIS